MMMMMMMMPMMATISKAMMMMPMMAMPPGSGGGGGGRGGGGGGGWGGERRGGDGRKMKRGHWEAETADESEEEVQLDVRQCQVCGKQTYLYNNLCLNTQCVLSCNSFNLLLWFVVLYICVIKEFFL